MKLSIYALLFTLLSCSCLISQANNCGTIQTEEFAEMLRKNKAQWHETIRKGKAPRFVPVTIHRVGNNSGLEKISKEKCYKAICQLNERYEFSGVDIYFYIKQFNELSNSTLHTNARAARAFINSAKDDSSLNMFCVKEIRSENNPEVTTLGFYSPGEQNDYIVMSAPSMGNNSYTLEHEMGHYFTLRHTHYGWEDEGYTQEGAGYDGQVPLGPCPKSYDEKITFRSITSSQVNGQAFVELVDGSNCDVAGDEICDTPADYGSGFCCGCCTMVNTILDANCDTLAPMFTNIMGYAGGCSKWEFSGDQVIAMQTSFDSPEREYLRVGEVSEYTPITDTVAIVSPGPLEKVDIYDNVKVSWEPVAGAEFYYVTVDGTKYETTETSLVVTSLEPNKFIVQWSVNAYSKFGGECFKGDDSVFSTGDQETSAVNEIAFVSDVSIYPNPVSSAQDITVAYNSAKSFNASINMYDITGKKVFTASNQAFAAGANNYRVPTAGLVEGIHILEIATEEGTITEKIIIE